MSDEAVAALKALSQTASGLTDSAQAGEVLRQAGAIAHDTALVPSRALGLAVLESSAAQEAFGVSIRGVPAADGGERVWRFEPRA